MSTIETLNKLLRPRADHAVVVVIELDSVICSGLSGLLTKHERSQCQRLYHEVDRRSAGVMRGLLRLGAGVITGEHPSSVRIERDRYNRPFIPGVPRDQYDLSVSRTRSCCAMILARGGRCGIDIEQVDPGVVTPDLVRFLTSEEDVAARLLGNPSDFFTRWTQTEAILKADGRGLSEGVGCVELGAERGGGGRCGQIGSKTWVLRAILAPSGVVGAIAMDHERQRVTQVFRGEIEGIWSSRILCASGD